MKSILTTFSKIVSNDGRLNNIVAYKKIDSDIGLIEAINIDVDSFINNVEFKENDLGFIIDSDDLNIYLLINNDGDLIIYTNNNNINFHVDQDGYLICEYIV
jgi:hypothetical protein